MSVRVTPPFEIIVSSRDVRESAMDVPLFTLASPMCGRAGNLAGPPTAGTAGFSSVTNGSDKGPFFAVRNNSRRSLCGATPSSFLTPDMPVSHADLNPALTLFLWSWYEGRDWWTV